MPKVLIVEDEADEARSMQMVLEKAKFDVELASDGKEALEKAMNVDAVVLDIILPRIHGDVVLKEMRAKNIKTPVVIVTAVSRSIGVEDDLKKIDSSIFFLQKPFTPEQLVKAVKNQLK